MEIRFVPADEKLMLSDESRKSRYNDWKNNLKKDLYLHEALQIAEDLM
jgi:hypothetical protein